MSVHEYSTPHRNPLERAAAEVLGISIRTARHWMADYTASGGTRSIPCVQIAQRRRVVSVAKLLELMGERDRCDA